MKISWLLVIKIPFSSLPFPNGKDQKWKFKFFRKYIDYELSSDTGKVELFFGGSSDGTWTKMGSPNQMLQGSNFGQSISADGDLNGDGLNDLVIGNTGTLHKMKLKALQKAKL